MEKQLQLLWLHEVKLATPSNLLVMVIVGGYETFVSRLGLQDHPDQPEWLSHVNATVLKVKLAMAIIGISSIHRLKTFIAINMLGTEESGYTEAGVMLKHSVYKRQSIGSITGIRLTIVNHKFNAAVAGSGWNIV
ncbi:MAG: YqhA family protein [Pseudomonadales bacterium]